MIKCLCGKEIDKFNKEVDKLIDQYIKVENSYADQQAVYTMKILKKLKEDIKNIGELS